MGPQQDVDDPVGLCRRIRVRQHPHDRRPGNRHRGPVQPLDPGRQRRQAHRTQDATRGPGQRLGEAPGPPQHHHPRGVALRVGEGIGEPQDPAHVGTTEGVDRLVGVAHGHHLRPAGGQSPQQGHLRRVRVLVLVDHDEAQSVTDRSAAHRVVDQHRGPVDQLGVVQGALEPQRVQVLLEELAHRLPRGDPGAPAHRGHGAPVQPDRSGAGQQGAYLLGDAPGADRPGQGLGPAQPTIADRPREQLPQPGVLLGGAEQAGRGQERLRVRMLAQQPVGVPVERAHDRQRTAAQALADPVGELLRGPTSEGQGQDRLGGHRIGRVPHPGDHELGQRGRLAGAGTGQDEQVAGAVLHHRALLGVQRQGRDRAGTRRVEHDPDPAAGPCPPNLTPGAHAAHPLGG